MALALAPTVKNYRADRNLLEKPGYFERAMVVVTTSVLLMGLPMDWFRTRQEFLAQDSNTRMVVAELVLMTFAILRIIGRLDNLVQIVKLEVTIFLFCGLAVASLFWSADIGQTISRAVVLSTVAAYGMYLIIRFELAQILRLLAIMFTISAVCNLVLVFAFPAYGVATSGEWDGVFYQKNGLGFAAAMALPALIVAARVTPRLRFVFWAATAAHLVLLFFSESKTMYLAGFGSICLLMVYRLFRGRKTLRGAVVTSMFGSTVFAVAFATANIALLAQWLDKDVTLTGRVPLWESLIPLALERLPLGYGYRAAFGGYFSPTHEIWIQFPWGPGHAHNALFHIVLELGLVGVALFVIGFFRAVKRAIHVVNIIPDAVGLWPLTFLSTSLLISVTESGITYSETGWLMYVVAVLAVANWTKNKIVLVDPDKLAEMKLAMEAAGLEVEDPLLDRELVGANVR